MISIAVLLTCHNRKVKSIACLEALFNNQIQEDIKFDVYLVDDGSSDGTYQAIKLNFPNVNIIVGNGNLFWNRGMILAWETAHKTNEYDFYLWLNDDTFIFNNSIQIIIDDSKQRNHMSIIVGACKSKVLNETSYSGFHKKNHQLINPNGTLQQCYFFNGNFVLIPKSVFDIVGNLDSFYKHSFGDFDYGLRALKLGILSYVSSEYIGICELNNTPNWRNPKINLLRRIKILYSPLGLSPVEHFVYSYKHWGLLKATFTFFSIHIRMIYPKFWKK